MVIRMMRWLGIAVLMISYPLMAHYTNQSAPNGNYNGNLGALLAIAPVVLVILMAAKQSVWRLIMLCILLSAALWAGWSALTQHFPLVYWLQDTGIQLILFITFGRTLIAGRQPLCTKFAKMLHGSLTPEHEMYARQVTVAWTLFFAVMTLTSTLLFFLAPLSIWSAFANLLTLPLIALMFIVEYGIRRWRLPETQHTHILDAIRAFRNTPLRPR